MKRKTFIGAIVGLALIPSCALARDPSMIRLVVGFSAGGVTDVMARVFSEELRKRLNTTVIVENRPGASGTIATAMVSHAAPDGSTLIMIPGTHTIVPAIQKVEFDTKTALTPITLIASAPTMLIVAKDSPYKDLNSLVADAKKHPGELPYGSSGIGTTAHFMAVQLEKEAEIQLNQIPFKSSGESLQAVLGGHVSMSFSAVNSALSAVQSGDVRALAIATEKRSKILPDVPTFAELGLPNVLSETWIGLAGPPNMSPDVVNKINQIVSESLHSPEVQKKLADIGVDPIGADPDEFNRVIVTEVDKFETLARAMKLPRN